MDLKITIVAVVLCVAALAEVIDNEITSTTPAEDPSKQFSERSFHHHEPDPTLKGIWKKRLVWRARWVKTWQARKVFVGVWKKMWGPVEVKEWVPIPKPPPGWIKPDHGPFLVKQLPH